MHQHSAKELDFAVAAIHLAVERIDPTVEARLGVYRWNDDDLIDVDLLKGGEELHLEVTCDRVLEHSTLEPVSLEHDLEEAIRELNRRLGLAEADLEQHPVLPELPEDLRRRRNRHEHTADELERATALLLSAVESVDPTVEAQVSSYRWHDDDMLDLDLIKEGEEVRLEVSCDRALERSTLEPVSLIHDVEEAVHDLNRRLSARRAS